MIKCLDCGLISHNPNDALEGYCGNCHKFLAKWLEIMPLTFGRARIIITDGHVIFNSW